MMNRRDFLTVSLKLGAVALIPTPALKAAEKLNGEELLNTLPYLELTNLEIGSNIYIYTETGKLLWSNDNIKTSTVKLKMTKKLVGQPVIIRQIKRDKMYQQFTSTPLTDHRQKYNSELIMPMMLEDKIYA